MGPISQKRLTVIFPPLAQKIVEMEKQIGEQIGIVQGWRLPVEQDALYAQGRMILAAVNIKRKLVNWAPLTDEQNRKIVTNAPMGYSWHEYGLAVDVVPLDTATLEPDWNANHPVWQKMLEIGKSLGLLSGISWKDEPHWQLTGRFPASPDDEARDIMKKGGMKAVWLAAVIGGVAK